MDVGNPITKCTDTPSSKLALQLWTDLGLQSAGYADTQQVVNHQVCKHKIHLQCAASMKPGIQCWFDPRSVKALGRKVFFFLQFLIFLPGM